MLTISDSYGGSTWYHDHTNQMRHNCMMVKKAHPSSDAREVLQFHVLHP